MQTSGICAREQALRLSGNPTPEQTSKLATELSKCLRKVINPHKQGSSKTPWKLDKQTIDSGESALRLLTDSLSPAQIIPVDETDLILLSISALLKEPNLDTAAWREALENLGKRNKKIRLTEAYLSIMEHAPMEWLEQHHRHTYKQLIERNMISDHNHVFLRVHHKLLKRPDLSERCLRSIEQHALSTYWTPESWTRELYQLRAEEKHLWTLPQVFLNHCREGGKLPERLIDHLRQQNHPILRAISRHNQQGIIELRDTNDIAFIQQWLSGTRLSKTQRLKSIRIGRKCDIVTMAEMIGALRSYGISITDIQKYSNRETAIPLKQFERSLKSLKAASHWKALTTATLSNEARESLKYCRLDTTWARIMHSRGMSIHDLAEVFRSRTQLLGTNGLRHYGGPIEACALLLTTQEPMITDAWVQAVEMVINER